MFSASKGSTVNVKKVTTKSAQTSKGAIGFVVGSSSRHRHDSASSKSFCYLFRLGGSGKKSVIGHARCLKGIKHGDTVVLEFAGNSCNYDWKAVSENPEASHLPLMSLSHFRNIYTDIVAQLRVIGARPIILSLPELLPQRYFDFVSQGLDKSNILRWLGGDVANLSGWHEQYNRELFKLGKELGVPIVDIGSLLLNCRSLGDCYSSDGMHPNKRGLAMIAESVVPSCLSV